MQHLTKPTYVFVRTRRKEDLERLAKKLDHAIEIEERPASDYRWAAVVSRSSWRLYMADAVDDITYTTGVKDNLDCDEPDRHSAMYRVWSAMMTLQDGGKYAFPSYNNGYEALPRRQDGSVVYDLFDVTDEFGYELIKPEDVIAIQSCDDGWEVHLLKSSGSYVAVKVFDDKNDAVELASDIRDVVATWPGFYDDLFDDPIFDGARRTTEDVDDVSSLSDALARKLANG